MKQSYIDYIEKTVRERCPELQELSFGCEVLVDSEKGIVTNSDSYGSDILFPSQINQGG